MIKLGAWCLVLAAMAGCHTPEDYILSPDLVDRVLRVTVSATTAVADGISRVTITAQMDPRTDADKRNVTFTTTVGTLLAGGKEGLSITVPSDSTGKAVVELRSPSVAALARIDITAGPVSRSAAVAFLALSWDEVFDVSLSRPSIPADGFSTTVITVFLKRLGTLQQRAVIIETSLGSLIAAGQPNSRVVTETADATGRVTVELQSEKTVGTARVRVTALEIPHEFDVGFTPADPAQIIRVSASPSSGPADGVTPIVVSATVPTGLPAGRRSVTFRSTIGQLIPTTIDADGSNVARASLVSTATGVAHITATVDGTTAETSAQFKPSLPDRLQVVLDAAELKSGGSMAISVTLVRASGIVSPHLEVSYSAATDTGAAVGSFSRVTLAENSVATATFSIGTTTFLGRVTITATAEGGATGRATLQVVP